jgi:signal peptide peptidase SppA
MSNSLIKSSLRAFLIAFFAILGILLSFALMALFFSSLSESEESVPNEYSVEIKPNADGVRKKLAKTAPVILELEINGVIGSLELNQSKIENLLVESRESTLKDDRVKGILLKITSPGGTINDADGIYRALKSYKARYNVPVYAYADGLCASGGMYVACAADKIYASDVTLVGSIGVITSSFMNVHQLKEKLGVSALTVYEGKGKDELNPLRAWKPDEDKTIKEIIKYYYASFVDLIVENRPLVSREALINEYGAQVFPATVSAKIGYIDEAGSSRNSTLKKMLHTLSIEDDFYQVVSLTSTNWLSQLIKTESPAFTGKITHEITYEGQLPAELLNKPLYLYRP